MFAVRFIGLFLLAAFGWAMGQTPGDGLNAFGKFISLSFFFVAPALYLLPTFEAWKNQHPNITSIALVNVFLGWSLIGWVIAIAWAFKKQEPSAPSASLVETKAEDASSISTTKKCPFCAEEVKAEAIKCKHCQSDLTQTAPSI